MANALSKIVARAKQLQGKQKSLTWKAAIKKASAEYRGGKLGAVKKSFRQTGSSNKKMDKKLKAKPPGKRKSASGKTYYERRKNRSDKPGQLQGIGAAKKVICDNLKSKLGSKLLRQTLSQKKTEKRKLGKEIAEIKKDLKKYL